MKILITTDWYLPAINGVVTSVLNLASGLREAGHDVRVLTLSSSRSSHVDKHVYYVGSIGVGKIYPKARMSGCAVSGNKEAKPPKISWLVKLKLKKCWAI